MTDKKPWYRSNQVVWVFMMFPVVGFWVASMVLSGSAQHVTRGVSALVWVGIICWMGMNARSGKSPTVTPPSDSPA
jgi:hypothetical protein